MQSKQVFNGQQVQTPIQSLTVRPQINLIYLNDRQQYIKQNRQQAPKFVQISSSQNQRNHNLSQIEQQLQREFSNQKQQSFHRYTLNLSSQFPSNVLQVGNQQQVNSYRAPQTVNKVNRQTYTKFDDDDPLIKQNRMESNNNIGELGYIQLQVETLYQKGCLSESFNQIMPACITIKASESDKQQRKSVDLFCVIDKSGSMSGEKIQNCQNSLLFLLDNLTPQDRLCLIQFDSVGKRLTPLKSVTDQNKQYFRKVIKSIQADGNDIIANGLEVAFKYIRERKYQNDVTSIFLLSDGQDGTARDQLPTQLGKLKFPVTLHTFGFGLDHDPQLLTFLASLRNGNFYFISQLGLLADFFLDALGALMSTIATNIQIQLKSYNDQNNFIFDVRKLYGKEWKKTQNALEYQIEQQQMSAGQKKDFVFEMLVPKSSYKSQDETTIFMGLITLKYQLVNTTQIIQQQENLEIVVVDDRKKLSINQKNLNVAQQLARVQSIELIEQAAQLCEQNQNEKAQGLLVQQQKRLQQQFEMKDIQNIYKDLEQAFKSCQRQVYFQYGQQQMCNISYNSSYQKGITTEFVNGIQQMPLQQGIYQNSTQYAMTQQMQQKRQIIK